MAQRPQYGEGYYWTAQPQSADPLPAFLLIGPVFGLNDHGSTVMPILNDLVRAIGARAAR